MKYAIYRKRKELEFARDLLLIRSSAGTDMDVSKPIESLIGELFPADEKERVVQDLMRSKQLSEEKPMKVKYDHGVLTLKV